MIKGPELRDAPQFLLDEIEQLVPARSRVVGLQQPTPDEVKVTFEDGSTCDVVLSDATAERVRSGEWRVQRDG